MGSDDAFRACDEDRERAVEVIREAYVSGRLSLAEFDERTTAALAARTWGDVRKLVSDIPIGPETGPLRPSPQRSRDRPVGRPGTDFPAPVLPIALVWLVAMLSLHSPAALIPVVFLAIVGLRWAAAGIRCGRGRCGQEGPRRRDESYWRPGRGD